jgi:hypothetical protein
MGSWKLNFIRNLPHAGVRTGLTPLTAAESPPAEHCSEQKANMLNSAGGRRAKTCFAHRRCNPSGSKTGTA